MAARAVSVTLSVAAHACLLYAAWGISLPEPHMQATIQGRLDITVVRSTQKEAPLPHPEMPAASVVTAVAVPSEADLMGEEQYPMPPQTIRKPPPRQPTSAIAQAQPKAKKDLPQTALAETPPLAQHLTSYKPVPEAEAKAKERSIAASSPAILEIESNYTAALLKAIEHHRRYPLRARRRGDEGEVVVDFTILKDGEITGIQIASTSHFTSLDHAASKALEQLGQFRPIPQQLQRTSWDFRIPIRFALN